MENSDSAHENDIIVTTNDHIENDNCDVTTNIELYNEINDEMSIFEEKVKYLYDEIILSDSLFINLRESDFDKFYAFVLNNSPAVKMLKKTMLTL